MLATAADSSTPPHLQLVDAQLQLAATEVERLEVEVGLADARAALELERSRTSREVGLGHDSEEAREGRRTSLEQVRAELEVLRAEQQPPPPPPEPIAASGGGTGTGAKTEVNAGPVQEEERLERELCAAQHELQLLQDPQGARQWRREQLREVKAALEQLRADGSGSGAADDTIGADGADAGGAGGAGAARALAEVRRERREGLMETAQARVVALACEVELSDTQVDLAMLRSEVSMGAPATAAAERADPPTTPHTSVVGPGEDAELVGIATEAAAARDVDGDDAGPDDGGGGVMLGGVATTTSGGVNHETRAKVVEAAEQIRQMTDRLPDLLQQVGQPSLSLPPMA